MQSLRPLELMVGLLLSVALATSPAAAQPAEPSGNGGERSLTDGDGGERPWAEGVAAEDQQTAIRLFQEGNALLKDSLFVRAVDKYREALQHWDHPAIHYNLALALLNLDKPIEVYETLKKTMEYGPAPLDQDKFEHARSYMQLIQKQLAHIEVVCDAEGAVVSLDGKQLFTAPGKQTVMVRIGEHSVVATKQGFEATTIRRNYGPGEEATVEVKLFTVEELTRYKRKWSQWKPWAVVGGGAAVTLVGGLLHAKARNDFDAFDEAIQACYDDSVRNACLPADANVSKRDSAESTQTLAIVSYAVGGAALATGIALVYLNRATPYRIDEQQKGSGGVSFAPVLGREVAGFSASFSF